MRQHDKRQALGRAPLGQGEIGRNLQAVGGLVPIGGDRVDQLRADAFITVGQIVHGTLVAVHAEQRHAIGRAIHLHNDGLAILAPAFQAHPLAGKGLGDPAPQRLIRRVQEPVGRALQAALCNADYGLGARIKDHAVPAIGFAGIGYAAIGAGQLVIQPLPALAAVDQQGGGVAAKRNQAGQINGRRFAIDTLVAPGAIQQQPPFAKPVRIIHPRHRRAIGIGEIIFGFRRTKLHQPAAGLVQVHLDQRKRVDIGIGVKAAHHQQRLPVANQRLRRAGHEFRSAPAFRQKLAPAIAPRQIQRHQPEAFGFARGIGRCLLRVGNHGDDMIISDPGERSHLGEIGGKGGDHLVVRRCPHLHL